MADPNAMVDQIRTQRDQFLKGQRDQQIQNVNAQQQQGNEAITRRMTALGQAGSGAHIAAGLKLNDQTTNQLNQVETNAAGARTQALQGDLAQANLDKSRQIQQGQFDTEQANKARTLNLADRQFALDESTTAANRIYADRESRKGEDGCCFIFLEARYGTGVLDKVVRRYRNEHMTAKNKRGYYIAAEFLVPLMRKYWLVKVLVRSLMTDPMVQYGKYYYGENRWGWVFKPLTKFWLGMFDYLGGSHEFIRENGKVV